MDSAVATWSSGSLQLRLATMKCRGCGGSRSVLLRPRKVCGSEMRRLSFTRRRGRTDVLWIRSESAADSFSGWTDKDNADESKKSKKKEWFGGMMGAGIAGAVLLAGLTFAATSISRRSTSKPLTTHQEVSLASYDEKGNVEKDEAGTDTSISSSLVFNESKAGNIDGEDNGNFLDDSKHESVDSDVHDGGFVESDVQSQNVSDLNEVLVSSDANQSPPELPESGIASGSLVASVLRESEGNLDTVSPEPTSGIEENLFDRSEISNDHHEELIGSEGKESSYSDSSAPSIEAVVIDVSANSGLDTAVEPQVVLREDSKDNIDNSKLPQASGDSEASSVEMKSLNESDLPETTLLPMATHLGNDQDKNDNKEMNKSKSLFESPTSKNSFSHAGIPAPSLVSAARQVVPGKVLVPAVVDPVQGQAIAALQVMKVIEADARPGDLCTRREYARWLVTASSALSRNTVSKVYPAMYIENVTELAFDDITPEDPDFSSIQGLAEAGLISSKLSNSDLKNEDQGPFYFYPESSLSRQDLVSWKMALEKRKLPEADRKTLYELSGFIDVDKINPEAWPAFVADLSSKEPGVVALAFGCTRLLQPEKPVTKAQAAVALATGEAADIVIEELARIEAEAVAENAVSAHNALVAEVEKDVNASFENELIMEKEKIDAIEKMAEEAQKELGRLKAEREEDRVALMKERAAIESEMEVLTRLRREMEEQLEGLVSNKVEISYEKDRINKLRVETENESQEIVKLQRELEVERKALSMARTWAEDEAKRAREHAKALEEARNRWEKRGIKVVVDKELKEESDVGATWLNAGKKQQLSVEGTENRAQTLVNKLKAMANDVGVKSKQFINKIIEKILYIVSALKEWASNAEAKAAELKEKSVEKARESARELKQNTAEFGFAVRDGARRVAGDCREGVEKLTQKFKT